MSKTITNKNSDEMLDNLLEQFGGKKDLDFELTIEEEFEEFIKLMNSTLLTKEYKIEVFEALKDGMSPGELIELKLEEGEKEVRYELFGKYLEDLFELSTERIRQIVVRGVGK